MASVIKDKKQGKRQNSKTEHYAATRGEGTESSAAGVKTHWREKMLGKLPAEECKLSCSLFPRIYGPWGCACWLLPHGPALLSRPLSRGRNTQPQGISQRWSFLEPWVAVAPIELGPRDAHSLKTITSWLYWDTATKRFQIELLHQSCLCV